MLSGEARTRASSFPKKSCAARCPRPPPEEACCHTDGAPWVWAWPRLWRRFSLPGRPTFDRRSLSRACSPREVDRLSKDTTIEPLSGALPAAKPSPDDRYLRVSRPTVTTFESGRHVQGPHQRCTHAVRGQLRRSGATSAAPLQGRRRHPVWTLPTGGPIHAARGRRGPHGIRRGDAHSQRPRHFPPRDGRPPGVRRSLLALSRWFARRGARRGGQHCPRRQRAVAGGGPWWGGDGALPTAPPHPAGIPSRRLAPLPHPDRRAGRRNARVSVRGRRHARPAARGARVASGLGRGDGTRTPPPIQPFSSRPAWTS